MTAYALKRVVLMNLRSSTKQNGKKGFIYKSSRDCHIKCAGGIEPRYPLEYDFVIRISNIL